MAAKNLSEAIERYDAQVRKERRIGQSSGEQGTQKLATTSIKDRADEVVANNTALATVDATDLIDLIAADLKKVTKATVGIPDSVQGESDYVALLIRLGGEAAVRAMAMDGVRRIYDSGLDSVEAVLNRVDELTLALDDLSVAFGGYDRDAFLAVTDLKSGNFLTQTTDLQISLASMIGRAKALNTFGGFGFDCTDLCDKMDNLFDAVLGPNTKISAIYALIAKIEALILELIDFLIDLLDIIDAALALRGDLEDANPNFKMHLKVMNTGLEAINDFISGYDALAESTNYQKGEVLRNFVLRLKSIQSAFCRSVCTDNKTIIEFSMADNLLVALTSAFNPIRQNLRDVIDRLKDNAEDWLRGFRSNVQREMAGFNGVILEIKGELDIITNIAEVVDLVVSGPTFPSPDRVNASDALAANGMDSVTDGYNRGSVAALEKVAADTATASGELASFVAKRREELRTSGSLDAAQESILNRIQGYLDRRQRARTQSAAVQATTTSDAFETRDADVKNSAKITEQLKPFI